MNPYLYIAMVGGFALFVIVADRVIGWWLTHGQQPMTWDETQEWLDFNEALAPYGRGQDRPEPGSVLDFRPEHKRGPKPAINPDYGYFADQEPNA